MFTADNTLEKLNKSFETLIDKKIELLDELRLHIIKIEKDIKEYQSQIEDHKTKGVYEKLNKKREQELLELSKKTKAKLDSWFGASIDEESEKLKIESKYLEDKNGIESKDNALIQLNFNLVEKNKILNESMSRHINEVAEAHKILLEFHKKRLEILLKSGQYDEAGLKELIEKVSALLSKFSSEVEKSLITPSTSANVSISREMITTKTNEFIKDAIRLSKEERECFETASIGHVLSTLDTRAAFTSPMAKNSAVLTEYLQESKATERLQAQLREADAKKKLEVAKQDVVALQGVVASSEQTIDRLKERDRAREEENRLLRLDYSSLLLTVGELKQQFLEFKKTGRAEIGGGQSPALLLSGGPSSPLPLRKIEGSLDLDQRKKAAMSTEYKN